MSKDTFYFSHDYEPTSDPKIQAMLGEFGAAGYGMYWRIIEMLHSDADHKLQKKKYILLALAKQMMSDVEYVTNFIDRCVDTFELLVEEGDFIFSNRVLKNIEEREEKRNNKVEAGRQGGLKSAEKKPDQSNATAKPKQTSSTATADPQQSSSNATAKPTKGKEWKGNDKKGEEESPLPPTEKISEEGEQDFQDELSEVLRPLNLNPVQTDSVTEAFAKMHAKGFTTDKIRPCVLWMMQHKPGWETKFTDLKIKDFWLQDTVKSNLEAEGYDRLDQKNQVRHVTIRLPDFPDQNAVREEIARLEAEIQEEFALDFSLGGPWEDAELQRQKIPPEYTDLNQKTPSESPLSTNFTPDYA